MAQTPAQRFLRITEIMYNPAGDLAINSDPQQFEFVELKNISSTATLTLTDVRLSAGATFSFATGTITTLGPGQYVLVVRNQAAFTALYGPGLPIAGQYSGALNNGGEILRLDEVNAGIILDFEYNNLWQPITDGTGFSLVHCDPTAAPSSWALGTSWRASTRANGSPGQGEPPAGATPRVRVNEILSHPTGDNSDFVELVNLDSTNVTIGGWFITDDLQDPRKYRVPDGTIIPAHGHLVFTQEQFGFGFSEYGEGAYVLGADASGQLNGFYHGFGFGAAPAGMGYGFYENSVGQEDFVLLAATTPWTLNAPPSVGPLIFSELMYNPSGAAEEFIEIENITSSPMPLYCTFTNEPGYGSWALTNTWRIRDGVDFDFPVGVNLPPGGLLLVVGFDPATNAAKTYGFRSQYNIPEAVPLYGPYDGILSNGGETVRLFSPDKPDMDAGTVIVPYVLRDKLSYGDNSPWPASADGGGSSLQRKQKQTYGNDPANWFGAAPTAGRPNTLAPFSIQQIILTGKAAVLIVPSVSGRAYTLQHRDELGSGAWISSSPVVAKGSSVSLTNSGISAPRRSYRVLAQ